MVEADLDRLAERAARLSAYARARARHRRDRIRRPLSRRGAARASGAEVFGCGGPHDAPGITSRSIWPIAQLDARGARDGSTRRRLSSRRANVRSGVVRIAARNLRSERHRNRAARAGGARLRAGDRRPRIVFTSSAEVYGARDAGEFPLRETLDLRPAQPVRREQSRGRSDSAWPKRAASGSTSSSRARSITSDPGQSERFVVASLAAQLARIAAGGAPQLLCRKSRARRAIFSTCATSCGVSSRWRATAKAAKSTTSAAARAVTIRDVLRELIAIAGVPVEVREDPQRACAARRTALRRQRRKAARAHRLASADSAVALAARHLCGDARPRAGRSRCALAKARSDGRFIERSGASGLRLQKSRPAAGAAGGRCWRSSDAPARAASRVGLPLAFAGELLRCWAVGYSGVTTRNDVVTAPNSSPPALTHTFAIRSISATSSPPPASRLPLPAQTARPGALAL